MTIKTNLDAHIHELFELKKTFEPAAREVFRELAGSVDFALTSAWPKRGDPRHPYATGESAAGLQVRRTARGISVRNRARHWSFVGKNPKRRKTGLIYRAIPAIIKEHDDQIVENLTTQLLHALNPEEG